LKRICCRIGAVRVSHVEIFWPSDEMGSGVVDGLQPLEQLTTDANEHTVTVVNSAAGEGIH